MMGIYMVTMMGFQYERDGPGTKLQPVGCGRNTTRQAPKLCVGGESIWRVCNCCKLLCGARKSFCMHAKVPLVMLLLHHHHPRFLLFKVVSSDFEFIPSNPCLCHLASSAHVLTLVW